jgi:hypothetical protein
MHHVLGWLNEHAAAIQAIAAVGIVLLTAILAWSTYRSSSDARRALQIAGISQLAPAGVATSLTGSGAPNAKLAIGPIPA